MQIPIGCRIDRKTWEITPLYREGSAEEFLQAMIPFQRAANEKDDSHETEVPPMK